MRLKQNLFWKFLATFQNIIFTLVLDHHLKHMPEKRGTLLLTPTVEYPVVYFREEEEESKLWSLICGRLLFRNDFQTGERGEQHQGGQHLQDAEEVRRGQADHPHVGGECPENNWVATRGHLTHNADISIKRGEGILPTPNLLPKSNGYSRTNCCTYREIR